MEFNGLFLLPAFHLVHFMFNSRIRAKRVELLDHLWKLCQEVIRMGVGIGTDSYGRPPRRPVGRRGRWKKWFSNRFLSTLREDRSSEKKFG